MLTAAGTSRTARLLRVALTTTSSIAGPASSAGALAGAAALDPLQSAAVASIARIMLDPVIGHPLYIELVARWRARLFLVVRVWVDRVADRRTRRRVRPALRPAGTLSESALGYRPKGARAAALAHRAVGVGSANR
jgi:hypothetical protein